MSGAVLVTGANGFIGRSLCAELVRRRYPVIAAIRGESMCNAQGRVNIQVADIGSGANWTVPLQNVDVVVHLAARVHVMRETKADPLAVFRTVNVHGTLNLARQAIESGVKRFVFLSTIGVNGQQTAVGKSFVESSEPNPHNAYALSKWEAERELSRLADEAGLDLVVIRPPLVYGFNAPGNFGSLMRAVQRGLPLPLGAVRNHRSLVALDNLVDFIITCMSHPKAKNQTFLVSDGQDLSTTELVRGMARAAGVPTRLLPVPVWVLQAGAMLLGRGEVARRLCGNLQLDISKARGLLDWAPPVSVEEGLWRAMGSGHGLPRVARGGGR